MKATRHLKALTLTMGVTVALAFGTAGHASARMSDDSSRTSAVNPGPATTETATAAPAPAPQPVKVEISGTVTAIGATSWTIDGTTVAVGARTEIGTTIVVGAQVKIHAIKGANGALQASEIQPVSYTHLTLPTKRIV